ncbi:type I-E CRISPR-associated protein Cas6/Cse3/CasE [Secundilactobacillus hailunensis]|uniref:Type I-E CRISPR-associated protein Cas6/Cse3/CasE n=1 Tax=Secundilactobacillus hailunensis TaxID=2559923 RepID=A0ABW1T7D4_9LACO|nr:type I-E CRISPR-associated protein Cas6/Cse3/CasE [Secundilactobacillus hailunensis]
MFLSRVEKANNNRQQIKSLTHLGAYHDWVEQSFPEEMKQGERLRHLWRLDQIAGREYLLILSQNKPDLQALSRYGVPGTAMTKAYDQFLNQLQPDELMRFRLTANPSYAVSHTGEKRGRVYPHVTVEQQRKWLIQRADKAGFKLVSQALSDATDQDDLAFDIVNREHPVLHRKSGRGVRLSRVTFEGLLQIQDLTVFKQTLINGLGREKAFGMGLMTVIPER